MAVMFRALSTRGSQGSGYDRLLDFSTTDQQGGPKLSRSRTTASPGRFFNLSRKSTPDRSKLDDVILATPESNFQAIVSSLSTPKVDIEAKYVAKEAKKASKIHPFFSLFLKSRKKKATAKPEFARYLQYLKEGGVWDPNSSKPVIY